MREATIFESPKDNMVTVTGASITTENVYYKIHYRVECPSCNVENIFYFLASQQQFPRDFELCCNDCGIQFKCKLELPFDPDSPITSAQVREGWKKNGVLPAKP